MSGTRDELTTPSVVGRAFSILEAFKASPTLGVTDLSCRTGLPKTTVHRLAADLVEVGALERIGDQYRIGLNLLELGTLHYHPSLREEVYPYLQDLRHLTGGTVHVGVLRGDEVVYVERLSARRQRSVRLGGRLPALVTATGRLLLAYGPIEHREALLLRPQLQLTARTLTEPKALRDEFALIVDQGYAVDVEGARAGYASIAVPIRGSAGRVVAGLTVLGPVDEFDHERAVPAALAIARILSRIAKTRGADTIV